MSAAVVVAVLAAGAGGAALRYLVSRGFAGRDRGFPWAVLVVNVVGSAIGGAVLGLAEAGGIGADIRLILLTGLCGGLTTFSTLSVETVQLVIDGRARFAVASGAANLVLGIGVAAAAYALTR
ncbi:CrcB protein [Microbacteriaceae bacterium SG_E_30_P1]|uniref:Fluoride-specific ion channel FluC n=1 Tax=Antiquaquibacter oligotrophicus TaxID=2880260 RepID=A0ABT6KRC5_9MICO|nr:CrcB family protein [Antiquaquibacter oligotrophicus]MDH6182534.1 CrcB protein [Antiquaquibacter oligotrophicus]UDF14497.1 CrcB family protein [Antiquaquibacter oligotrophicus]